MLVPLAWAFAAVAHAELVQAETVRIGTLVMGALLVAFTVLSWNDMREGVLFAWRLVLAVGVALTLVGPVAVFADLVDVRLAAFVYTGDHGGARSETDTRKVSRP